MGEVKKTLGQAHEMIEAAERCVGNERLARLIIVHVLLQQALNECQTVEIETRDAGVDPDIVYQRGHEIIRELNKEEKP